MSEHVATGGRGRALLTQLFRFAVVGGVGLVIDVAVFNLLRAHEPFGWPAWPVAAKAISTLLAIAVNWIGNRAWTFHDRRRDDAGREAIEFLVASLIGGGVSVLCLIISRDLLGLTSALDDNVSANVIGLGLGSAVRFCAYRWWVYGDRGSSSHGQTGTRMSTPAPPALSSRPPA